MKTSGVNPGGSKLSGWQSSGILIFRLNTAPALDPQTFPKRLTGWFQCTHGEAESLEEPEPDFNKHNAEGPELSRGSHPSRS